MLRFILPSLLMLSLACQSDAASDPSDTDDATTTGTPTTTGEVCTWFEHLDCVEECAEEGWATGTCDAELEEACVCDGFGDAACDIGTQAYCTCLPELGAGSCDDADIETVYLNCFSGSWDYVECFGTYFMDGVIDCNAAQLGC